MIIAKLIKVYSKINIIYKIYYILFIKQIHDSNNQEIFIRLNIKQFKYLIYYIQYQYINSVKVGYNES